MFGKLNRMSKDESGITALETAIILIAFVVVAAVFAFAVLSAGTFSTEQSREAIYSGLEQVQGSLELRGGLIARAAVTGSTGTITDVVFTVSNVAGGEPVDFTTVDKVVVIEYRDSSQRKQIEDWSVEWVGYYDGDTIIEERELLELTVPLEGKLSQALGVNTQFVIEVKPPLGSPLYIQRTTPPSIDYVNDLQ